MKQCLLTPVLLHLVPSDCLKSQQPLVGSIQGKIIDRKQAPIPYAALTATNIDSVEPESNRITTGADEKGFYQFVDVPEGRYSIVVKKTGYRNYKILEVTVQRSRQHAGHQNVSAPLIAHIARRGPRIGKNQPIARVQRSFIFGHRSLYGLGPFGYPTRRTDR
jgi:hypothetical protein